MTDYYQRFVIPDIPAVIQQFTKAIAEARVAQESAVVAHLTLTFGEMETQLVRISEQTKELADAAIREHIASSHKRAVQTQAGGLVDRIQSDALVPTAGIVGIARITGELDQLAYWRAQEYGLDTQNFIGRVLHGFFQDQGGANPQVPQPGIDSQPLFSPDPLGGAGVIQHPIEPRHFLKDGTQIAADFWLRETRRVASETAAKIRAVV